MQWTGTGCIKIAGREIFYGDVISEKEQKILGKERIKQFKSRGKIGEVPVAAPAVDNHALIAEKEALQKANTDLEQKVISLTEGNNALRSELNKAKKSFAEFENTLKELAQSKDELAKEGKELRVAITATEKTNAELEVKLAKLDAKTKGAGPKGGDGQ